MRRASALSVANKAAEMDAKFQDQLATQLAAVQSDDGKAELLREANEKVRASSCFAPGT